METKAQLTGSVEGGGGGKRKVKDKFIEMNQVYNELNCCMFIPKHVKINY